MKANWDDYTKSNSNKEDHEEVSNMCFMTIEDEVKSLELDDEFSDDEFNNLSYEELLNDFNDLHKNCENLF